VGPVGIEVRPAPVFNPYRSQRFEVNMYSESYFDGDDNPPEINEREERRRKASAPVVRPLARLESAETTWPRPCARVHWGRNSRDVGGEQRLTKRMGSHPKENLNCKESCREPMAVEWDGRINGEISKTRDAESEMSPFGVLTPG